ncbi:MAG: hypothetical protein KIT24_08200 [Phycisphaeraceae bacterium]|nr:hypothetical protein [Phycisphaeraceae bacterium]
MPTDTRYPGVHLLTPEIAPLRLAFTLEPPSPATPDPALDSAWAQRMQANPRLFPGPILTVVDLARAGPSHITLRCRPDTYDRFAVQPEYATGVRLLAVTGLLIDERAASPRVLLARRSREVHTYPGCWELAPAGGVEPPPPGASLSLDLLCRQLQAEFREEFGLDDTAPPLPPAEALAIARDQATFSDDIVLRVALCDEHITAINRAVRQWEYDDLFWLSRQDAPAWLRAHAAETIPPTLAVLHWLGWC